MKTKITLLIALISSISFLMGQTTIPGGDVSGIWTAGGSPYLIEGDIIVPADSLLLIEPGVTIEFQGSYIFIIHGLIDAQGTAADSIMFRAPGTSGHRGLHIDTDPDVTDSIIFTYCRLQDGNCYGAWPVNCGAGIGIWEFDRVRIEHCLFIDNQAWTGAQAGGGALALAGFNGIISYNSFIDNSSTYGAGIFAWNGSNCIISNNYFYDNYATYEGAGIQVWTLSDPLIFNNVFIQNRTNQRGGAISIYDISNPLISHNLMVDNLALLRGGAVFMELECNPMFLNNTIINNRANARGGAIEIFDKSCPVFINNIIWNNTSPAGSQLSNGDTLCIPDFYNNDIQYGKDSIVGFVSQCEWKANIDAYPEFEDTTAGIYHLSWISPCLDAGVDTILDPDGTISDMGAYYFDQTGIGIGDVSVEKSRLHLDNYPNPFSDNTVIRFRVPGLLIVDCRLSIFDVRGREIDVFANERLSSGEYQLNYNASNLPGGIYIMRLQVGGELLSRKIVKR